MAISSLNLSLAFTILLSSSLSALITLTAYRISSAFCSRPPPPLLPTPAALAMLSKAFSIGNEGPLCFLLATAGRSRCTGEGGGLSEIPFAFIASSLSLRLTLSASNSTTFASSSFTSSASLPFSSLFFNSCCRTWISLLYCFTRALSETTSLTSTWFVTVFARAANLSVCDVSSACRLAWDMVATMTHRAFPPKLGCRILVRLLFLYGMKSPGLPSESFEITLPSCMRLRLIWVLSCALTPTLPLLASLSLPARSTKFRVDTRTDPFPFLLDDPLCLLSMTMRKIVCDRLLSRLSLVAPVCLRCRPFEIRLLTLRLSFTVSSCRPFTLTPSTGSSLICSRSPACHRFWGGASRSRSSSL